MNLIHLNIGKRLWLGFGIVIALLLAVAAIAVTRINQINATADLILKDRFAMLQLVNEIHDHQNDQARYLRDATLSAKDPGQVDILLTRADGEALSNAELFNRIKSLIASPEGTAIVDATAPKRLAYDAATANLAKLLHEGKAEDATAFLLGDFQTPQREYFSASNGLITYQEDLIAAGGEQIAADGNFAKHMTEGLTAVAAVLAVAIAVLTARSITAPIASAVAFAKQVADGDLTSRVQVKARDETGVLLTALQHMQDNLMHIVGGVQRGSEGVAAASVQIAQGNSDLSERTEVQASVLEATVASMSELSSTVQQNADSARRGNHLAMDASSIAVKGGAVVSQVVETMKGINDSSRRIADIIGVIDGIAFQTNILALNAAVEAARAGEQGRGFAVVATEVRALAGRSADAAKEIKTLIGASVERVAQGTNLVDQAGATMADLVASIRRVTDVMGEISASSDQQASGVSQVSEAVAQMDLVTQQNAALVEQMAAAASSLKSQAAELQQSVAVFKLGSGQHAPVLLREAPRSGAATGAAIKGRQGGEGRVAHSQSRPKPITSQQPTAAKTATSPLALAGHAEEDWETF